MKYSNGKPYNPSKESDKCTTLIYSPSTNYTDEIMRIVARENGLNFGSDIIGYSIRYICIMKYRG